MAIDTSNDLCAAALDLASRGLRVHPTHGVVDGACTCPKGADCSSAGKHPLLSDWPQRASTDEAEIQQWWDEWPDANIGVATGAASGLVVLDVDPDKDGDDSLEALIDEVGGLPDTPEVLTGGGGRHFYFRHPGGQVPNSAGTLGPGLDVRGDDGFVIAPPSTHISGRDYAWEASAEIADVPLAELPDALRQRLRRRESMRTRKQPDWVNPALRGVGEGQRNETAAKLAGYFLGDGMRADQVTFLLNASFGPNCRPPLPADEIGRVVESVARTRTRAAAQATKSLDEQARQRRAATRATKRPRPEPPGDADVALPDEPPGGRPPAEYPTTDAGNAELIAATFGGRLRFDHQRQRWLVWDRHRWTEDPDGEPWRLALRGTRLRYRDAEDLADADQRKRVARWAIDSESRARLDNALALARDLAPIADPGDQWDLDPWLLGCANGVLDLRTGVLRDGRWLWPTATWKDWDGVAMNGMKAIALVSTDRGQTWPEYLNVLDQYNRGVFSWEQSIVQLPDDRLLQVAWAYIEATGHHEPTPYTISADGRTFSAPRPTGLKGQTTKLHVLPDGTVLALYRRDDKPGLWANRCRIDGDDWVNLEEQLVWDGAPSGMAGEGRGADELVDLQFGFPQMVDLPSGGVFAVLWGQEDDVRNIRWFRIRVT